MHLDGKVAHPLSVFATFHLYFNALEAEASRSIGVGGSKCSEHSKVFYHHDDDSYENTYYFNIHGLA